MRAKDILQRLEDELETLQSEATSLEARRDARQVSANHMKDLIEEIRADKTPETTE